MLADIITPRISELGKIKIGGKGEERQKSGGGTWRLPVKYDHFVIVTLHRDQRGDFIQDEELMKQLAAEHASTDGKLRSIPIMLLSNDPDDVMQSAWVWYSGKRIAGRSDGKTLQVWYTGKEWLPADKPREVPWDAIKHPAMMDGKAQRFKLHSTFNCVIMAKQSKFGGVYKFRTTSQITASQLYGGLLHIKELNGGILRGIPLRLAVRPMQVSPDGKTTTVFVVHVELLGNDLMAIQKQALERARFELENKSAMQQAAIQYRKLLAPPGVNESPDEQRYNAEEFQPETHEKAPPAVSDPLAAQLGLSTPAATVVQQEPERQEPEEEFDEFGIPLPPADQGDAYDGSDASDILAGGKVNAAR